MWVGVSPLVGSKGSTAPARLIVASRHFSAVFAFLMSHIPFPIDSLMAYFSTKHGVTCGSRSGDGCVGRPKLRYAGCSLGTTWAVQKKLNNTNANLVTAATERTYHPTPTIALDENIWPWLLMRCIQPIQSGSSFGETPGRSRMQRWGRSWRVM